jgi:hypothetical protein
VTCSPALKGGASRDRRGSGIGHRHPPLPALLDATGLPSPKPMGRTVRCPERPR